MKTQIQKTKTKKRLILKNKFSSRFEIELSNKFLIFQIELGSQFYIRLLSIDINDLISADNIVELKNRNDYIEGVVLHESYKTDKSLINILYKATVLKNTIDSFINHKNLSKKVTIKKLNAYGYGSGIIVILNTANQKTISIKDCNTELNIKYTKNNNDTDNLLIEDYFKAASLNISEFIQKYKEMLLKANKENIIKKATKLIN